MAINARFRAACVASGLTTAWIGLARTEAAQAPDMEYAVFPGEGSATDAESVATKKKATKKKATHKKATKKATSRKKVSLYRGADDITHGTFAQKVTPTDDGEMSEFDFLLDFNAETDSVMMYFSLLALQDVEGSIEPQLSMLIPMDMVPSYEGMSFSYLFPGLDELMLMDAIMNENVEYLTMASSMLPMMSAYLSGDMLRADFSGAWLTFYNINGDRTTLSEVIGEVTGTIETVPAPWTLAILFGGAAGVPACRRRR